MITVYLASGILAINQCVVLVSYSLTKSPLSAADKGVQIAITASIGVIAAIIALASKP